jgi:hypothetical protein
VEPRTKEKAGYGAPTGMVVWDCDGAILVWNIAATGWDGVPVGDTKSVATRNDRVATDEKPRANTDTGYGAATGATEWGGVGATAACNTAAAGWDAAPAGCSTG